MTVIHHVRVHRSEENLAREDQLAYKIAEVAADPVAVEPDVVEMIINRVIDNAAVAAASLTRGPVTAARAQALDHPVSRGGHGGTLFGEPNESVSSPEWAAWANGVAVRELDYHDTFLAAEYSHPGDNIPPILAVAQHVGADGAALVRGIATGYEIQMDLVRAICLHKHKIDHVAHLGPSAAAGIGTLLGLDADTIYQAVGQALHTTTATRQSRKGEISTWKAHAPAFAGKMAVEAVDRAMRGQTSPSPIYEGEDGVIAWMLDGPGRALRRAAAGAGRGQARDPRLVHEGALGRVPGPGVDRPGAPDPRHAPRADRPGERRLHRAAHQPPHPLRDRLGRERSAEVRPARHPRDPRPLRCRTSSRSRCRTAAGITSGSYAPERAQRPDTVALWHKITTAEDAEWTRRYHSEDPNEKAFGGRVEIRLTDGSTIDR